MSSLNAAPDPKEMLGPKAHEEVSKSTATYDVPAYSGPLLEIGDILLRLQRLSGNPVTKARIWPEMAVPGDLRGPSWDYHWHELEAYADSVSTWPNKTE